MSNVSILGHSLTGNITEYLDAERHINEGSPSGFTHLYRPRTGLGVNDRGAHSLKVPVYDVSFIPHKTVGEKENDLVLQFPVHPDMKSRFEDCTSLTPIKYLKGYATSSGRTILIQDTDSLYYRKLSYMNRLGRIVRTMSPVHLEASVQASKTLTDARSKEDKLPYTFFSEPRGACLLGNMKGWGCVSRTFLPQHVEHNDFQHQIPAFALFSRSFDRTPINSILSQVVSQNKRLNDPDEFFLEYVRPVQMMYFDSLNEHGLQVEAHAQNVIYFFDSNWKVVCIGYRDMESVDRDLSLQLVLGIKVMNETGYKELKLTDKNYSIKHSFMYDFKLGKYLLSPLISEWSKTTGISPKYVISLTKKYARQRIQSLPSFIFPKDQYDYASIIHDENKPRPYRNCGNPIFR